MQLVFGWGGRGFDNIGVFDGPAAGFLNLLAGDARMYGNHGEFFANRIGSPDREIGD
jgi:hypothetical protein